jgi:hypothetical protein
VAAHNHGVHEVVVDPDEEEPGGVGHLLVERRPDLREEQVGLEAGLLDVKQRSCQTQSHSITGSIASVLPYGDMMQLHTCSRVPFFGS